MRHLLVPAHIKWEYTLKSYQIERRRERTRRDKIKQEKVEGVHILTQSATTREQNKRIRISKKGIHSFVVTPDHVSER